MGFWNMCILLSCICVYILYIDQHISASVFEQRQERTSFYSSTCLRHFQLINDISCTSMNVDQNQVIAESLSVDFANLSWWVVYCRECIDLDQCTVALMINIPAQ